MKPGDRVRVDGLQGTFLLLDCSDPSLVMLRAKSGATLRCGRLALRPVQGERGPKSLEDDGPAIAPQAVFLPGHNRS